ncbi:MAG: leucine-rich repeat domain-containing protein [Clostridium sp.]|nr:leucine-rich repeat domain-containing protein [Clostridium sp.]
MKKFKSKMVTAALALCMVVGFASAVTVQAAYDEVTDTVYGVVARDWPVWEGDDEDWNASYMDWYGMWLPGGDLQITYKDKETNEEGEPLSASDLQLTYYGDKVEPNPYEENGLPEEQPIGAAVLTDNGDGSVHFDPAGQTGYYLVTDLEHPETPLLIKAHYPEIGFYSEPEQTPDNLLVDNITRYQGEAKAVYLNINNEYDAYSLTLADGEEEGTDDNPEPAPFIVYTWDEETNYGTSTGVKNYFTVEAVTGKDGWYKVTIQSEDGFDIRACVWKKDNEEDVGYDLSSWLSVEPTQPLGLAVKQKGEDTYNSYLDGSYIGSAVCEFTLYNVSLNESGKATFTDITISDTNKLNVYPAIWEEKDDELVPDIDNPVGEDTVELKMNGGYISLAFKREGQFFLSCDGYDEMIYCNVWLPGLAFYNADDRDIATSYIPKEITYKEAKESTVYMLPWIDNRVDESNELIIPDPASIDPETIEIHAYDQDGKNVDDYISVTEPSEDGYDYTVTVTTEATGDFKLTATAKNIGGFYGDEPAEIYDVENTIDVKCIPVEAITITTPPSKTTYTEGAVFDKSGMVVEAVYADDTTEELSEFKVSAEPLKVSDKEVTVSWKDKTVKQAVTVEAATTQAPATTETPKPETPATTEAPKPETPATEAKVGDTNVLDKVTYRVTSADTGKKEVAYVNGEKNAKKVKIPSTVTINGTVYRVTEIAANAFSGEKNMTSVTIPSTVVTIGDNAFKNCKKLKKVVIPGNVETIGKNAFSGCKKAKTININSKKITKVGKNAFKNIAPKATIKVPKSKKKAYKTLLKKSGYKGKVK